MLRRFWRNSDGRGTTLRAAAAARVSALGHKIVLILLLFVTIRSKMFTDDRGGTSANTAGEGRRYPVIAASVRLYESGAMTTHSSSVKPDE